MNNLAIKVENLKIVFDEKTEQELVLLNDFSYDFKKGKIYFIIGNSNSGKTTLVSHFNGLLRSKYGKIQVGDFVIDNHKKKIKNVKTLRKNIGMVFQFPEYQLFKPTVEKDVAFGPINFGMSKILAYEQARKYLDEMQMDFDTYHKRSPFDLSGGQKRRVAIAGILAIEPEIIIFDEPCAGLDPQGEELILNTIKRLKEVGKTLIVITHSMNHVLRIADEVILLGNQKIIYQGEPYGIFTNDEMLKENSLQKPEVIKLIDELVEKDSYFKFLYKTKPRNVVELVKNINKNN